jgi:hypothetical protein
MPTRVRCCASNLEAKIVLDIVLSGQDAELELPGMIVRLRAADTDEGLNAAFDEDDGALSVQDLVRTHRSIALMSLLWTSSPHHITTWLAALHAGGVPTRPRGHHRRQPRLYRPLSIRDLCGVLPPLALLHRARARARTLRSSTVRSDPCT